MKLLKGQPMRLTYFHVTEKVKWRRKHDDNF